VNKIRKHLGFPQIQQASRNSKVWLSRVRGSTSDETRLKAAPPLHHFSPCLMNFNFIAFCRSSLERVTENLTYLHRDAPTPAAGIGMSIAWRHV
jgi:hypothetical protein